MTEITCLIQYLALPVFKILIINYMNVFLHKNVLTVVLTGCYSFCLIHGQSAFGTEQFISYEKVKDAFTISAPGRSAPLLISSKEWPGVIRAFRDLQTDIGKVAALTPELNCDKIPGSKEIIIAGTIGKSELIDLFVKNKKINVENIQGKWETFVIQVIKKPFRGVKRALLTVGSDNARFSKTNHQILSPGYHTLKIWMVDPGVVLQKIIVDTGGLGQSYPGPPESYKAK
jgi:hypothetical protein